VSDQVAIGIMSVDKQMSELTVCVGRVGGSSGTKLFGGFIFFVCGMVV